MKKILLFVTLTFSSLSAAEVICETVQSSIKKIRCKYMALSQEAPRKVTFNWVSPDNVGDNRSRTHTVGPGHISVFDFRYFSGRSEGKWTITVVEENNKNSVSTEYIKDSNAEVVPETMDPVLRGR